MKRSLIGIWLLLLFSTSAFAQTMNVTEKMLSNGLKVLMKEDHRSPVVTFQVWYKVGSRNEKLGKTGMSHVLEHMMFKGTKKYGPKTFSQTVMRNGGNDNAFTGRDYTAYFENFAADRIDISLELESDRMHNLMLDQSAFQSERDVVKEERRMRTEDDPTSAMVEQMMATAFLAHPYQWPVIGWMADLGNLTLDDLSRHYRTYYAPNNATIVVVGDFDTKALLPKIENYFGSIPRGPAVPAVGAAEPEQQGERRVTVKRPAELPAVFTGYHAPDIKHGDTYALEVLQSILASGKSSRLYSSLVYDQQIAVYAGGDYDNITNDPNLFYLYAAAMPGRTAGELEKALYAEIDKLKAEPATDQELRKAKNQIESNFIMGQDSIFYQAMLLGQFETVADWKLLEKYVDNIRTVTKEDVMRVAKKYFSEDNRTVGVLVPVQDPRQAAQKPGTAH
ncbi:MAG: peptidase M16 [Nitrospirae bacterium GWD2_57_9]|nr:MAG: peptidase M16 [Nitrospirae bacterium GWD2_57_9]